MDSCNVKTQICVTRPQCVNSHSYQAALCYHSPQLISLSCFCTINYAAGILNKCITLLIGVNCGVLIQVRTSVGVQDFVEQLKNCFNSLFIDSKMRMEISVCGVLSVVMYIPVHCFSEIICFSEEYNKEWEGEITGIIWGHDLQFNSRSPGSSTMRGKNSVSHKFFIPS